jgi:hypothetical protein
VLALILVILAAPPARFEATRLTVEADGRAVAEAVQLTVGDVTLHSHTAHRRPDARCPEGRWRLAEVGLRAPNQTATATGAEACLPESVAFEGLALATGRGRLRAERGVVRDGVLVAEGVFATGCACADPPWHLTAQRVEVQPDGLWAHWPVFWLGPVPVLASPVGYLPLGRRRTGFLPPVLGWHGQDGAHGRLPFFLTLGEQADLTVAPGWRAGHGFAGRARLRWLSDAQHDGTLQARGLLGEGLSLTGAGSSRWGAVRLGVDGTLSTDPATYFTQHRGLMLRARDHLRFDLSLAASDATGGLGLRGGRLTDVRPSQAGVPPSTWLPEIWLNWQVPVAGARVGLRSRTLTQLADGVDPRLSTDLALEITRPLWLSALHLEPVLGTATQVHLGAVEPGNDAPQQVATAWAGAAATVAAARRFATTRHRVSVRLDGRAAAVSAPIDAPVLPQDQPWAARGVGAALNNQLSGVGWHGNVQLSATYDAALDGRWVPLAEGALHTRWLGAQGASAGLDAAWANLRVGLLDGINAQLGATRYTPGAHLPWLRSPTPQRPLRWTTDVQAARTAQAGLALPLGVLRLQYQAVLDLTEPGLRGQWGTLAVQGGCGCWSAGLGASHERGQRWPDLSLRFALSGL